MEIVTKMNRREFCKVAGSGAAIITLGGRSVGSDFSTPEKVRPITVFTKCLQFLSYEEMAGVLAETGFDGADVPVRPGGQVLPENIRTDLPKVVKTLNRAGLSLPIMVTGIVDSYDPLTERILGTASEQGVKHYRMGWIPYNEKKSIPENLDGLKSAFARLERMNRKFGIRGEYQNHSGTRIGGPVWDLYHIFKDMDPQFIGVQYDVRHAMVEGGVSWILGMKLLAPWIGTTDIKDFIWEKDSNGAWKIKNVPLGEGMVDWKTYFTEYKKLNVEAPVSIHYEYDLGGAESGSNTTTMPLPEIKKWLKKDLVVLKEQFNKYKL